MILRNKNPKTESLLTRLTGKPRVWTGLVLLALIAAGAGLFATNLLVKPRYASTELVRLYDKEQEKNPYAPALSVDDLFKRNAQLDKLILPERLHQAISLLPAQFPELNLVPSQIEPNVTTQVVRDTPFIEIKVEAGSKKAAEYIAGGIAANLLMLQIEQHEPLNLRMESTTQVSAHLLTPTDPVFALPLALLVALILGGIAARAMLTSFNNLPEIVKWGACLFLGLLIGVSAGLFFPVAFLMLSGIGLVAVLSLFRFEWGLFGLMALLPFHNLFRSYTAQEPWKFARLLDYWQQGLLALILLAAFWQLRRYLSSFKFGRAALQNLWKNLLLHEKVLVAFGTLGLIYVFVAPKLVVGVSGLVEDYACFGLYFVARQVGRKRFPLTPNLAQTPANPANQVSGNPVRINPIVRMNGLAWTLLSGGVVSMITIFQYLGTGTAAYLIWNGYAVGNPQFNTLTANYLYGTVDTRPVYRAVSTLMNPLLLAFYAVTVSALALALCVFLHKRSHKLWALAVGAGLINALLLSFTRSAWIGAALSIAAIALLAIFKKLRPTSWKNFLLYALVIAAVVICDFVPWNVIVGSFGDNDLSQTGGLFGSLSSYTSATLKGRDGTSDYHVKSLLDVGVNQLLLKHPLGAGLGMEGTVANHYIADGTIKNPLPWVESYYFVIAGQLGVFGLLLFLALLASTAWDLLKQWRGSDPKSQMWLVGLSVAGMATLLGVAVSSITLPNWSDSAVSWTLWAVIGLAFSPAARQTSELTQILTPLSTTANQTLAAETKKVLA